MSASAMNSAVFSGVTEPPYSMRMASAVSPDRSRSVRRISEIAASAVGRVGGEAGADRPDRLVRDDERRRDIDAEQTAAHLL